MLTQHKVTTAKGLFAFNIFRGEVLGNRQHSETEVSGGGGGAYGNHGHVAAVSSKTTRYQTFFIKPEGEAEREFSRVNSDIPVRDGHVVTAVLPIKEGDEYGYYTHFFNHNTRKWHREVDKIKYAAGFGIPLLLSWVAGLTTLVLATVVLLDVIGGWAILVGPISGIFAGVIPYQRVMGRRVKAFEDSTGFQALKRDIEAFEIVSVRTNAAFPYR